MNKGTLHIGTKLLLATAMTLGDYNQYRGWNIPADQNTEDKGFLVEYIDGGKSNHPDHKGYISWSPEDVFHNAYKASGEMSFGMAVEAAKRGYKVARIGWNGSGMFAYIVHERTEETKVKDLDTFGAYMYYREHWALFTAQKDVATWAPSGSDSLADDWVIVE